MTILDRILDTKRQEVATGKQARPAEELRAALQDAPPVRDFFAPLATDGSIKLIAEVKKASPSKGVIRADFDPVRIARAYESAGASCVSVLTDESYFQGSLKDLTSVRNAIDLPVLRKDFLIDRYQLLEARVAGADAVLLIAECLDDCNLRALHNEAIDLGMTPLVEFYEPVNRARVLDAGAQLIGINNRDLHTFETDLAHTIRMKAEIPAEHVIVGESGIHGRQDAEMLQNAGVQAMLVGEHLMSQPDVMAATRALLGKSP